MARDDDRRERRGRDDDDSGRRGRDRDGGERSSSRDRDRDDDRGSRRSRDDEGERGRGGKDFEYVRRSADAMRQRSEGGDYDKFLNGKIKMYKPKDGENCIRMLPPTWKGAEHYGHDIYVHYGVGPDRQTYLCLYKMKGEPDPIYEEYERFVRSMDENNERDKKYKKDLESRKRVVVYLIDRNDERSGVQAWAMPASLDRDIVKVSIDRKTGEVLPIDHPEDGYDVTFEKTGTRDRTKYDGVAIDRRSSPLGNSRWLEFAQDNPIPEQLIFYDYEHISKAFGSKGSHSARDEERGGAREREEEERGRGRDDDRRERSRDDDRSDRRDSSRERDRDESRGRSSRDEPDFTWESLHEMTRSELRDIVEDKKLKVDPSDAKDADDLADMVCEELGINKKRGRDSEREESRGRDRDDDRGSSRERTRERDDDRGERRRGGDDDPELEKGLDKLRERRRERERD